MENEMENTHEQRLIKLRGEDNWAIWKFQAKIELLGSQTLGLVTGEDSKPRAPSGTQSPTRLSEYNAQLRKWERLEGRALRTIVGGLSEETMFHITNCTTSKEMWDKLHEVYDAKNESSLYMLNQEWYNIKMNDGENMEKYIAKIQSLAHKIHSVSEKIPEDLVIMKILVSLTPEYKHFSTAWESTAAADRTLAKLIPRLKSEEKKIHSSLGNNAGEALVARKSNFQRKPKRKGNCNYCKKEGHWEKECYSKKRDGKSKQTGEAFIQETLLSMPTDQNNNKDIWYLDSGSSSHMTSRLEWFIVFRYLDEKIPIKIGNGKLIYATGIGSINIQAFDNNNWIEKHLDEVLYVPLASYNLFSLSMALKKGYTQSSSGTKTVLRKEGAIKAVGELDKNLFVMKFKVIPPVIKPISQNILVSKKLDTQNLQIWHKRLGHQNYKHLTEMLELKGIKVDRNSKPFCEPCVVGKMHRRNFKTSTSQTNKVADIVHTDVCGYMQVTSLGGARYFLLFKDDFSHYRHVYFIKTKDEVEKCLKNYILRVEKETGNKINILRSDNGLEFINKKMNDLIFTNGIKHQKSTPYTPEQNGSAERENRTIMEAARTMLHEAKLPLHLWAEAVNAAVYILNRTGTSSKPGFTPFELWHGKQANLTEFKIYGCQAMTHIPDQQRQKLDKKAKKGILVGYNDNVKGYRIWFPDERKVMTHTNVLFNEKCSDDVIIFDLEQTSNDEEDGELASNNNQNSKGSHDHNDNLNPKVENEAATNSSYESLPADEYCSADVCSLLDNTGPINWVQCDGKCQQWYHVHCIGANEEEIANDQDFFCPMCIKSIDETSTICMITDQQIALMCNEPISFMDAKKHPECDKWMDAMDEEIKALDKNNTWTLVKKPENANVLKNRWVYKIKQNPDGSTERYRARLVVKGCQQRAGIDYFETFSPVVRFDSVRTVLAIATAEKMHIMQFDVKTAFLYGDLDEEVFMNQPEGFSDNTERVCKLKKSLYGLKQASKCWNKKFTKLLKKFNMYSLDADQCVFRSTGTLENCVILAIYVDDGLIMSKDKKKIQELLDHLKDEFEIVMMDLKMFLGIQFKQTIDGSMILHQCLYTNKILERFRAKDANIVSIPADSHQNLSLFNKTSSEQIPLEVPYREAVGSLLFLAMVSRPDITFAVNAVSQHCQNPQKPHWNAIKRIFKYLKGTSNYGIKFNAGNNIKQLQGFTDADFATDVKTRRSISGYIIKIGDAPICWGSRKQRQTTLSTAEAEFVAACNTTTNLIWCKKLILQLINQPLSPTILLIDNQSAISWIRNGQFENKSKHVDVKYKFIFDLNNKKEIIPKYLNTDMQQADLFTKALPVKRFQRLRDMIGVKEAENQKQLDF